MNLFVQCSIFHFCFLRVVDMIYTEVMASFIPFPLRSGRCSENSWANCIVMMNGAM